MAPDETVHFYRAYQLGEGQIVAQTQKEGVGGYVPKVSIQNDQGQNKNMVITPGNYFERAKPDIFVKFPSSAQYSPVLYVPQTIGIRVGRMVSRSLGAMVTVGRLFNLAAYIIMVMIAIKIAKKGKWVYVVVGLFPVAIQQAASLSADVMTIGLSFITIAFIHSLFLQKDKMQNIQWLQLLILAATISLTKQTNAVLLLPLVFLPARLFKDFKAKAVCIVSVGAISLFTIISWYLIIKHQYHNLNITLETGIPNVVPETQLKNIISHPLSFLKILFKSFVFEGFKGMPTADVYWISSFGAFSWFTYKLPLTFVILGYALLLLILLNNDSEEKGEKLAQTAIIQTGTYILYVVMIAVALYITWTTLGAAQVSGIQGRYFIPVIPLLIPLFALLSRWIRVHFDKPYRAGQLVAVISSINLAAFVVITFKWFY